MSQLVKVNQQVPAQVNRLQRVHQNQRQPVLASQQAPVRQSVALNRHQVAQVFLNRQVEVPF